MKLRTFWVFLVLVLNTTTQPSLHRDPVMDSDEQVVYATDYMLEIVDPAGVSVNPLREPSPNFLIPRSVALVLLFTTMLGLFLYTLVRAIQAARICLALCQTRPWFLCPQPVLIRCSTLMAIMVILPAKRVFSSDIYFDYSVTADNNLYTVGDEVKWEITANIQGETRGIRDLSVDLYESRNELMIEPMSETFFSFDKPGIVESFIPLNYYDNGMLANYFHYWNYFEVSGTGNGGYGSVDTLAVRQFVDHTHTKFLEALDKTGGKLCQGSYIVMKAGFHYLDVVHNSGSIWIDENGNTDDISNWDSDRNTAFYVTETEDADLGSTDMTTLSVISNSWDGIGCDETNNFCDEADVNEDGEVNDLDVSDLFYYGGSNISVEDDSFVYQDAVVPTASEVTQASFSTAAITTELDEMSSFSVLSTKASIFSNLGRTLMFAAESGDTGDELYSLKNGNLSSFDLNEGDLSSNPHLFNKNALSTFFYRQR